jgi:hypothetical protein
LGCNHKSGKKTIITEDKYEKVVILHSLLKMRGALYTYKVRRIEKSVVDYIEDPRLFGSNDTILVNVNRFVK